MHLLISQHCCHWNSYREKGKQRESQASSKRMKAYGCTHVQLILVVPLLRVSILLLAATRSNGVQKPVCNELFLTNQRRKQAASQHDHHHHHQEDMSSNDRWLCHAGSPSRLIRSFARAVEPSVTQTVLRTRSNGSVFHLGTCQ